MENKTVAIVGKAQRTRDFAPYADPTVEVWGYQDFVFRHMQRVTGMFEMHPDWQTTDRYPKEYKLWLQRPHEFPIWMHQADPLIPASRTYPRAEINTRFQQNTYKGGERVKNYYSSSTPYAIALAPHLGYGRIELYGIELSTADGYTAERDSVFYWLGKADALGVQVAVHAESGLFDEKLYPFVL